MRPAQARFVIGCRMRELREAAGVPLTKAAVLSGWDKGHLSRVERGHTKPSRELIEWYDESFGAGSALVNQLMELDAAVRAGKDTSMRDMRRRDSMPHPMLLGGSVPADHDPEDRAGSSARPCPTAPGSAATRSSRRPGRSATAARVAGTIAG